jgi:hypothetical protein
MPLPASSCKAAFRSKRHQASWPPSSNALLFHADPSATHEVRSGVDERCVTNLGNARAGLVFGPLRVDREVDI